MRYQNQTHFTDIFIIVLPLRKKVLKRSIFTILQWLLCSHLPNIINPCKFELLQKASQQNDCTSASNFMTLSPWVKVQIIQTSIKMYSLVLFNIYGVWNKSVHMHPDTSQRQGIFYKIAPTDLSSLNIHPAKWFGWTSTKQVVTAYSISSQFMS